MHCVALCTFSLDLDGVSCDRSATFRCHPVVISPFDRNCGLLTSDTICIVHSAINSACTSQGFLLRLTAHHDRTWLLCQLQTARRPNRTLWAAPCGMAASDIPVHRVALAAAALIAVLLLLGSRAGFSSLRTHLSSSAGAWQAAADDRFVQVKQICHLPLKEVLSCHATQRYSKRAGVV